ncbi:MAG: NAD(+) diphosphatase [Alphaproteobacteria bacterium]|nr:NAD(+) diphosphatase [Alphaproteobacteria bacterium]
MSSAANAPIVFTASDLDRVSALRKDRDWLARHLIDRQSRFLPLRELKVLIRPGREPSIDWRGAGEVVEALAEGASTVLLGLRDGVAHFAVDVTGQAVAADGWGKFIDVRTIAPQVTAAESAILAQARSLVDWHARHRFCAVCGSPSQLADGGYVRRCRNETCGAEHFPRTDPVVIMMVLRGEQCLLGRQPRFMPGMYSALAGFVEPGESIEEAVRREVMEEVGIRAGVVRYVASQPWPFPSSLMIGCFAEALDGAITIDAEELDEARWFAKSEIPAMLERSTTMEQPRMPPPLSLAHQLALAWLEGR